MVPHRFVVNTRLHGLEIGQWVNFYRLHLPCKININTATSCPGCADAQEFMKKVDDTMKPTSHICLNLGHVPKAGYATYALGRRKKNAVRS